MPQPNSSLAGGCGALQAEYEVLAQRASDLRRQQNDHVLTYRLITGEERRLALGQIVHVLLPEPAQSRASGVILASCGFSLGGATRGQYRRRGVFPAIFGTFVMTLLMSLAVTPFGVLAALYLREYEARADRAHRTHCGQ